MLSGFRNSGLFRLPIYRESEHEYYAGLKLAADQETKRLVEEGSNSLDSEVLHNFYRDHPVSQNPEKIAWNYNRIVGWVEFYCFGRVIKANLWFKRGERIPRHFSKVIFDYMGTIGDVTTTYYSSNDQIRKDIQTFIHEFQAGKLRKLPRGCVVDSETFLRSLKHLDIKRLIEQIYSERLTRR